MNADFVFAYIMLGVAFCIAGAIISWIAVTIKRRVKEKREREEQLRALYEDENYYSFRISTIFPNSYTAIDFETATPDGMACQLGLVQVDNGKIVQECVYLIQPPENMYNRHNSHVHGLTPEDTESAPTFDKIWSVVSPFFEGKFIVAHNMSFDKAVLKKNLQFYGLPEPMVAGYGCTCEPFGKVPLYSAACYFGIGLCEHHDALSDARACALLVQEYKQRYGEFVRIPRLEEEKQAVSSEKNRGLKEDEKQKRAVSARNKGWADSLEDIPDNHFKGKTVVITGELDSFPERDELAAILKSLGARVTGSVSGKTSIVICGEGAGPTKLKQIEECRSRGAVIEVLDEQDLLDLLSEAGTKTGQSATK